MCKIKTEYVLPFLRDAGVKSQEYSLRPLCPVWNSAVKGFSCGHLSGRDIMILQLETESWDLFISPNSSPHCAEHIKYQRKKKKINNLPTIITDLLIVSQQWQAQLFTSFSIVKNNAAPTVNVSIKGCIYTSSVTSRISKTTPEPLQINYTFSLSRMVLVLLILNGFSDTSLHL